jgi:hypothetical protein
MKPGRELDAIIAEKVMGEPDIIKVTSDYVGAELNWPVPQYSTSIAAAWEVVEALQKRFQRTINPATDGFLIQWHIEQNLNKDLSSDYYVRFEFESNKYESEIARASSLPHAICLAALKAVDAV